MTDQLFNIPDNSSKSFLELILKEQAKELDLEDLLKLKENIKDPMILGILIFKLIEERKKTNQLLLDINNKYNVLELKLNNNNNNNKNYNYNNSNDNNNNNNNNNNTHSGSFFNILCETDEKIISFIREKGKADAENIKNLLDYKGTNAASQRLNKLVKEKILTKIQSGRKVYFVLK
jgi:hypothetical protein